MVLKALDHFNGQSRAEEQRKATQAEIAHWRQRTKNADLLFSKARMIEKDWERDHAEADAEIERLQAQVSEQYEAASRLFSGTNMTDIPIAGSPSRRRKARSLK